MKWILLPRFLTYLYERGIWQEDSLEEELTCCIRHEILKLMGTEDGDLEEKVGGSENVKEEADSVKEDFEEPGKTRKEKI